MPQANAADEMTGMFTLCADEGLLEGTRTACRPVALIQTEEQLEARRELLPCWLAKLRITAARTFDQSSGCVELWTARSSRRSRLPCSRPEPGSDDDRTVVNMGRKWFV